MDVEYTLKRGAKPTAAQLEEIHSAAQLENNHSAAHFNELSESQLNEIRRLAQARNQKMRKRTVSLRIDEESIDIAKSIGENYTGIFREILFRVLRDPELLKSCLGNSTSVR